MLTAIDKYILRQIIGPLTMTLAIAAMLLILERMLRLFDFVVNEGGPVDIVFKMLANLTPHYLGLALPVGLFLGVLVAFRRLSLSSELDAILTSGVSLTRLLRPILGLTVFLMLVNIALTGWVQPVSRYTYQGLVFDLRSGALGASIRVGEFVNFGDDIVLRVEQSQNQGSELEGIFLERATANGKITVTAEKGGFFTTGDRQTIILRLQNGMLVDLNESQNKPRILSFKRQDLTINLPNPEAFRARGGEERELTLFELASQMDEPSLRVEERNAIRGQFHWRLMHSLTFLALPFLGIAGGITNKRTGSPAGMIVGLSLLILYNELMEGMELIIAGGGSPYLSVWALFAGFVALSLYFFHTVAFRVGGDPLRALNHLWARLRTPVRRRLMTMMGVERT